MKHLYCYLEKIGERIAGVLILIIAILFCAVGFAMLAPVAGLILAIPIIALSFYLFNAPLSKTCSL